MTRVRDCGRTGVLPGGSVRVRATGSGDGRRAGFAGVATCGSVWACPVCAEKVLVRRQEEVGRALSTWVGLGGRFAMVTMTMRHRKGQSLGSLWDGLSYAWGSVTSGRRWAAVQERFGIEGWLRVVEVTHGAAGWHVHIHAALLLPGSATSQSVEVLGGEMYATWAGALKRRGFTASRAHGVDAQLWDAGDLGSDRLSEYFTKADYPDDPDVGRAAMELTRADTKVARMGNRTPFAILRDVVDGSDDLSWSAGEDDLALWREWEVASKGRRQLTWSKGLRARLLADVEATDEQIAAEELGSEADDLVEIPAEGWALVTSLGIEEFILDQAERDDGGKSLNVYLIARGIPFTVVRGPGGRSELADAAAQRGPGRA